MTSALFFYYDGGMTDIMPVVDFSQFKKLKKGEGPKRDATTALKAAPVTPRPSVVDQFVVPQEERPKMPYTKEKYVVRENENLVAWERETRKFLLNLSTAHGHRVSASMVFEWATNLSVKALMEVQDPNVRSQLRWINQILTHHFGKPYMTWIGGVKIPRAYRVPVGWYLTRHRPLTLELYLQYREGTLDKR